MRNAQASQLDFATPLETKRPSKSSRKAHLRLLTKNQEKGRALTRSHARARTLSQRSRELRPFLSVLIIVVTLFSTVFFKMEVRRMGYLVLKQSREFKGIQDEVRMKVMTFAKVTRPDRVREFALSRLTLSDARRGQIIHITADRIAVPQ